MKTRTLNLNVTFGMTVVATDEVFKDIAEQRQKARDMSPEKIESLDKETAYKRSLAISDITDEELLVVALRMALRDTLRSDLPREMSGGGIRAKTGDVKVTVTPKKVAQTLTPEVGYKLTNTLKIQNAVINCLHCRTLANAGQTYKCSTCRNIDEVK